MSQPLSGLPLSPPASIFWLARSDRSGLYSASGTTSSSETCGKITLGISTLIEPYGTPSLFRSGNSGRPKDALPPVLVMNIYFAKQR
jgi:hypothetical protein